MQPSEWRDRLLRRLAVVVDTERYSYTVRRSAVIAVQQMLDADHRLRNDSSDALLARVLPPWATRERLVGGRYAQIRVGRPPLDCRDVWD
jgi:hypothetical protein